MGPLFVLITGGNRGLGGGLVERFLALPEHVSSRSCILPCIMYLSITTDCNRRCPRPGQRNLKSTCQSSQGPGEQFDYDQVRRSY